MMLIALYRVASFLYLFDVVGTVDINMEGGAPPPHTKFIVIVRPDHDELYG
jgi:hypothetical protein